MGNHSDGFSATLRVQRVMISCLLVTNVILQLLNMLTHTITVIWMIEGL